MELLDNYAFLLLLLPVLTTFYPLYLLAKPDTPADKFFLFFENHSNCEDVINHLTVLEKEQGKNYQPHRSKIREYYSDRKLHPQEINTIEKIIIHSYFEHFQYRWIAYKKADWILRIIFLIPLIICSIFFFDYLLDFAIHEGLDGVIFYFLILGVIAVPVLLIVMVVNTAFTLYLSFMAMLFSSKGNIQRASKTFDYMLFALHPFSKVYRKGQSRTKKNKSK